MTNTPVAYQLKFNYSNDVQMVECLLYIYAKTQLDVELSQREVVFLREYVLSGYSDKTKRNIRINTGVKHKNLNTFNCNLQKKGLLMPHPTNQKLKILNPELLKISEFFKMESSKKFVLVDLKETEDGNKTDTL